MNRPMLFPFVLAIAIAAAACAEAPGRALVAPDETAVARDAVATAPAPIRVMTRNLYLGANIDPVLAGGAGAAAAAWAEIQHTSYPERAAALAAEIAARRPHLIGLQEVTRYVVMDPAMNPLAVIDFLDILGLHLIPYGLRYQVVTRATNLRTEPPIPVGQLLVEYTDGDAILALSGEDAAVTVNDAGWRPYADENQADLGPLLGLNLRSFQWADVTVESQRFLFVNTHLEIQRWAEQQEAQAAELLAFVEARDGAVLMVGDFNSAANPDAPAASRTATYGMIRDAGFDDLWLRGEGRFTDGGLTCCQASDLSNPESELDQRIDFVFARNVPSGAGYAGGAELEVFGEEPADRFTAAGGYQLWPSDHAGLFAELWMPPEPVVN